MNRVFGIAVLAGLAACGAENLPPVEADVLVVGGTAKGVAAAVAAKAEGADVFLVTPFTYLGEDMAGTLELGLPDGQKPTTALVKKLWAGASDLAAYDYWPDRKCPHPRWIYKNDWWERLSEYGRPPSPSDSVYYDSDVSYTCVLRTRAKVRRVEVIAFERRTREGDGATGRVTGTFLDGPRAGESFELANCGLAFNVAGDAYQPGAKAVSFAADVEAPFTKMSIKVEKAASAHHQFVSRIWFHLADPESSFAPPTPLKVKRTFDRELVDAGVGFLTGAAVERVLRGADGAPCGVVAATRSGRLTVRARRVVDATRYGTLARFAPGGPALPVAKEETFSRVVIVDGPPPETSGMKVERLPGTFPVSHTTATGRMYRCTFKLPMKDGRYPSFAAAEWAARDLTCTRDLMDDADLLVWHAPGWKPLEDRIRDGEALGRAAARAARGARPAQACAEQVNPAPAEWGAYDVVVVGGGTSGAPAALAAARAGARVLLVEYRHVLGGVATDGMVLGYYDGNHCGYTEAFKKGNREIGGRHGLYRRAETLRKWCGDAGVEVMFGAMGVGAVTENGAVTAVDVATPLGVGRVRAKAFIDATGNADVAAAAGAQTAFFGAREFALQSAGQSPHRLGRGGINSDFGYLYDADARDLWLFGLRARAGAPNAWDIAKMPDSRERRRIVPDYLLNAQDVTANRPFPDVVVQARSRQDSHGFLVDDFCALAETSVTPVKEGGEMRSKFDVNVPLRSLLPKGIGHLAVVGLGAGCARDVLPMVRMQADLMNMGYATGLAAAMAARNGGDFRALDLAVLRKTLVGEGILRKEALGWTADVDVSSDALLAASVKSMGQAFKGSHVVCRPENRARAIPLLRAAYASAADAEARQIYAVTLGYFGDATGVETLLGLVTKKEKCAIPSRKGAFGGGHTGMNAWMLALGRTKDRRALVPLLHQLKKLGPNPTVASVRGVTLALEALGDPGAAPALAACLSQPGLHGFAVKDFRELPPQGGYGLGPEMDNCIRELSFARALLACGDSDGLARRTLEAYARDPRGVLSLHAKTLLSAR